MKAFWESLAGKRTHILVIAALLLNLFGVMDTPQGLSLDQVDTKFLMQEFLIGAISTFKMGLDRILKK